MVTPPSANDSAGWLVYWTQLGQPWRTECEIDEQRQHFLQDRLASYQHNHLTAPFQALKLTRADIEWLLASHRDEDGVGPIDWADASQRARRGIDLRGAVLIRQDLSGLPLARLIGGIPLDQTSSPDQLRSNALQAVECALRRVDLRGAELGGATLAGCQLEQSNLESAVLAHADLEGANLDRTQLRSANLIGANVQHASLWEANLDQARLIDTQLVGAALNRAHCEGTNFARANLQEANLIDAHLQGADLSGAHLQKAVMIGANVRLADLSGWHPPTLESKSRAGQLTHLECADLSLARLDGANLTDVYLEGAILISASLERTILINAHLETAQLQMANLRQATLEKAHVASANLQRAHCEGADFNSARFAGAMASPESCARLRQLGHDLPARLAPADLRSVYFDSETSLRSAILTSEGTDQESQSSPSCVLVADANWNGVNLTVVDWKQLSILGDEQLISTQFSPGTPLDAQHYEEYLLSAIRANRQLAVALESQGMNEDARQFAYAAQSLQRRMLRMQIARQRKLSAIGAYFFSWLLWSLAGYGYRMRRIVIAYLGTIGVFAMLYLLTNASCPLTASGAIEGACGSQPLWGRILSSLLISVTAFHGRVFTSGFSAGSILEGIAAAEAICGVVIEGVFIAMLAQRFFGK